MGPELEALTRSQPLDEFLLDLLDPLDEEDEELLTNDPE